MNKNCAALLILCLFSFSFVFPQTVEEIIEKYNEKMGNAKFCLSSSFIIQGTMKDSTHYFEFSTFFKHPQKIRFDIKDNESNKTNITFFDGVNGGAIISDKKYPEYFYTEKNDSMKYLIEGFEDRLFNYEEKGYQALLLQQDSCDGKKIYLIKLMKLFGNEYKYFIDAVTYLPFKIELKEKFRHQWYKRIIYLSEYKTFQGFLYPTKCLIYANGKTLIEKNIDSISLNENLPDNIFVMPKNKSGLLQKPAAVDKILMKLKK